MSACPQHKLDNCECACLIAFLPLMQILIVAAVVDFLIALASGESGLRWVSALVPKQNRPTP